MYEESLYINLPGLVIEPKEKGGEVTIQQKSQPCIIVDVGEGNTVSIFNSRLLYKGGDPLPMKATRVVTDDTSIMSKNKANDSYNETMSQLSISQNQQTNHKKG